jgi:protease I
VPANVTSKGKIGVLIEEHFDETEFRRFGEFFPAHGYELECISRLWGQPQLTFWGNDMKSAATVKIDIDQARPADYKGIIVIGGYATDRLRYEEHPNPGQPNHSPAVKFLREAVAAMDRGQLKIGTICHALWLFCAAPELMRGRRVTCAHNILYDVQNAGGTVIFDGNETAVLQVDGNLISARHPGVVEEFMTAFLAELEKPTTDGARVGGWAGARAS